MKKIILFACALACGALVYAQNLFYHVAAGPATVLAVSSSAVAFTSGNFPTAHVYVMLQAQGSDLYVTYDGTTPSAVNGEVLRTGASGYFFRRDALAMKFIAPTGSGTIFAQPCDFVGAGTAGSL